MYIPDIRCQAHTVNGLRYRAVIKKWKEGNAVTPEEADTMWWELFNEYIKNGYRNLPIENSLYVKPSEERKLGSYRFPIDLCIIDSLCEYTVSSSFNKGIILTPEKVNTVWWDLWSDFKTHGHDYVITRVYGYNPLKKGENKQ